MVLTIYINYYVYIQDFFFKKKRKNHQRPVPGPNEVIEEVHRERACLHGCREFPWAHSGIGFHRRSTVPGVLIDLLALWPGKATQVLGNGRRGLWWGRNTTSGPNTVILGCTRRRAVGFCLITCLLTFLLCFFPTVYLSMLMILTKLVVKD